jgi:hypothetical protein
MLSLDRSKIARLSQRAIAEGWLTVSLRERQAGAGAARTVVELK